MHGNAGMGLEILASRAQHCQRCRGGDGCCALLGYCTLDERVGNDNARRSHGTHRLSTAPRSLAVLLLQEGNAVAAAAMADLVSAAFMQATLAMTSSVAGLFTCRAYAVCQVSQT